MCGSLGEGWKPICDHPSYCKSDDKSLYIGQDHHMTHWHQFRNTGYNPKGWVSYGEFRGSLAAFLFCFPDGKTDALPLKLSKVGGAGLAQVDDGSGPKFGMTE